MKLDDIADACQPELMRMHPQPSNNDRVAPALANASIVGASMHKRPLNSKNVFAPLLLKMDEGPLTSTKGKMLDAGESEKFVFGIHTFLALSTDGTKDRRSLARRPIYCHSNSSTPSGSSPTSTR